MKHSLPLLFLSLVAVKAQAFTARMPAEQTNGAEEAAETKAVFSAFHTLNVETLQIGVCDAVSVNGCNCPFCTQLRGAGR